MEAKKHEKKARRIANPPELVSSVKIMKRKIQKRLGEAFEQADDVLLEMPTTISITVIKDAINGKLKSSTHKHNVYVKYGEELLPFP